ncbi:MAG TPA: T9SS type A sorting domain-containing protein [Crocinitomicaceae bacterium]|nr:T9SS type A sorting domain-containing protein [Crocinitomicaceae bacterium]
MKKLLPLIALAIIFSLQSLAQNSFQDAYNANPEVPRGILEAVAWTNTHMVHLQNQQAGCSGIPKAFGIMGLHDNGGNYFIENGKVVATLSGISISEQKQSAENQIMAYAIAFSQRIQQQQILDGHGVNGQSVRAVIHSLSEIPDSGIVNMLARDMQVYSILRFMNSEEKATEFNFTKSLFNLPAIFGSDNFAVLSSKTVRFTANSILSDGNVAYKSPVSMNKSTEYGPAIWNPAPSCNYSSRSGTAISAVTIHTIQGSYAGAISWSQNCSSNVSYHYVIRSSDGQVTQMVLEANKAWHVGSGNPYTIGYEHEGYIDDASWYTTPMYNSSADLSRDVCNSGYGIPPLRTFYGAATVGTNTLGACTKIKGHQHFPSQSHTDPGINWDWERYYRLINFDTPFTNITNPTGTFFDSGGASSNYQDDERLIWRFGAGTSTSVTVDFTSFDIELDYDKLFIYDGDSINDPIIGSWTGTTSPGQITSTGGYLVVEFRSDCGTTAPGWNATYSISEPVVIPVDSISPITLITPNTTWKTADFTVDFVDNDNMSGVADKFYLVGEKNLLENDWQAAGSNRFAYETFEDNANSWFAVTGTYSMNGGVYRFSDIAEQNSNTYMSVDQISSEVYLYEWDQTITSSDINQRAGLHFFCDNPNLSNRGNSYFVYLRESDNAIEIFSVDNNVFTSQSFTAHTLNIGQTYNSKVLYNPTTGWIKVFIDDEFVSEWQDATPLTAGNFISLRSGGCAVDFDNVQVYHSRNNQVTISVSSEMTIESENAIESGYIKTVVIDSANNFSTPSSSVYLIDVTAPVLNILNDGNSADIDTFYFATIESNWNIEDIHSDVSNFDVAIGTSAGLDDVVSWMTNSISSVYSSVLSSPIINQIYYISVRATNNAGLMNEFYSDGQRYVSTAGINDLSKVLESIVIYPNPSSESLQFKNVSEEFEVIISDAKGKICLQQKFQPSSQIDVSNFATGSYSVLLRIKNQFIVKKVVIE